MRVTHRRIARLVLPALVSATLCSCANDPFQPLADALRGPKDARASVAQTATGPSVPNGAAARETCERIAMVLPIDVDTAYARVMSRLRFRTMEERKRIA